MVQPDNETHAADGTPPRPAATTLGELRASGHEYRDRQRGNPAQPAGQDARGRGPVSRHRRVRPDGAPAPGAGPAGRPRHDPARRARPGQDPPDPDPVRPARRVDARRRGLRDQRPPLPAGLRPVPAPGRRAGRRPAGHLAAPQRALRREAGHAGHQRGRPDRRHRPGQGGRGPDAGRPGDDPLRPGAADQPRHLLPQRAARPGRADPGRAAERAGGAGHRRARLRAAAAAGPGPGGQRQPRGLHQPGPDHHPAEGPVRRGDPHPLPAHAGRRAGADPAGGAGRLGRRRPRRGPARAPGRGHRPVHPAGPGLARGGLAVRGLGPVRDRRRRVRGRLRGPPGRADRRGRSRWPGSATCRRSSARCAARSSSRSARRAGSTEVLDHLLRRAIADTFRVPARQCRPERAAGHVRGRRLGGDRRPGARGHAAEPDRRGPRPGQDHGPAAAWTAASRSARPPRRWSSRWRACT